MFAGVTAARVLAPAVTSLLVALYYKYYKSGAKTEVPDHRYPYPPGGGGGAPPRPQEDSAPPDLDPAVVDKILNVVNAHLDANRNFNNPAVLDEILKLLRNSDPAGDIVDKIDKLCSKPKTSTETESPTITHGTRLDHAPAGLDLAILDAIRTIDPGVLDEMLKLGPLILDQIRNQNAVSFPPHLQDDPAVVDAIPPRYLDPAVVDVILTLVNSHLDANRSFNNPAVLDEIQKLIRNFDPADDIVGKVEKLCLESKTETEQYEHRGGGGGENESGDVGGGDVEKAAGESWSMTYQYYPVRPEAEDCSFYLKTGTCKFGSNCKFNHPVNRKSNQVAETPGQTECKYYLAPGGCKYGNACRYIHSREKPTVAPVVDTNFAGLPIRPGEKECAYYMRHGECKYASNCRFSHPDPVAEGGSNPSSGYDKGGPALQGASEATWSAPRLLNETPPYMPIMVPSSPGGPSQTTEWNGYQSPERSMPARPPYIMNNSMAESNIYKQYPYPNQVEEFPERPGQPVCSYFLRTGGCKFKSGCKYHHPKIQTAVLPSYTFSDKGLPSRPAPANLPEQSMPVPQPYGIDNSVTQTTPYQQHPLKKQVEESPERPGQPVCNLFSKTGYCHKSNCNYHHPKYQTLVSPSCELSDKGLPLRPGQNICTQYSSYGICKSGPSCKFDHPSSSTLTL